jgi:hypothetical protein
LRKSHHVERVWEAGSVYDLGGNKNGGKGRKNGDTYSSLCNFLVQLDLLAIEHKMAQPSTCTTTGHRMNEKAREKNLYSL